MQGEALKEKFLSAACKQLHVCLSLVLKVEGLLLSLRSFFFRERRREPAATLSLPQLDMLCVALFRLFSILA